jgi:hypothetical protein
MFPASKKVLWESNTRLFFKGTALEILKVTKAAWLYRIYLINIYGSSVLFEIIFKVSYLQMHLNKQRTAYEVQKCAGFIL